MNKELMRKLGFGEQVDNFENGRCATCGGEIGVFKDKQSKKEYTISGMCQKCQDGVFETPKVKKGTEKDIEMNMRELRLESMLIVTKVLKVMNETDFIDITQPEYGLILIKVSINHEFERERYTESIQDMIDNQLIPNSPVDMMYKLVVEVKK